MNIEAANDILTYGRNDVGPMTDDKRETLSESDWQETREEFQRRVIENVEELLEGFYDSTTIRNLVYNRAFRANEVLPKRDRRPKTTTAFVAEQIHRAHDGGADQRATLISFAIVVAEYADILDDVVDSDVAEGYEDEALLVTQLLLPVLTRLLHDLDDRAVEYWTGHATALVQAPLVYETASDPSREAYLDLLDRQALLRSSITGLAAVVGGGDEEAIERAETVGRLVHCLMQFATDTEQYGDDDDPWNAVSLFDEDAFVDQIDAYRDELASVTDTYPSPYAERMRRFWERDYSKRYKDAVSTE